MPQEVDIMGYSVAALTLEQTLDLVQDGLEDDIPQRHASLNASIFMTVKDGRAPSRLLDDATLLTADGVSILLASRLLAAHPLPERVTGCDLMTALADRAVDRGWSVYLLGAAPGVAKAVGAQLRGRGVRVVGCRHGYFPAQHDRLVGEEIALAAPDLLFVAMGFPRQDEFLDTLEHDQLPGFSMGVGGSFDVLAGRAWRAPRWVQAVGLEWLWRTMLQPRQRWRAGLWEPLRFCGHVARTWLSVRLDGGAK